VTDAPLWVAVSEDEQIEQTGDDREPGAPRLAGDESLPQVEDAADPEKLAGNKEQEQGEQEQREEIALPDH
jgi:hypothetical protein